jgi:hypothetical protein
LPAHNGDDADAREPHDLGNCRAEVSLVGATSF